MAHSYTNGEGVGAQDRYRETKTDKRDVEMETEAL